MTELPQYKGIYKGKVAHGLFYMDFNPTDHKYPEELIEYAYNKELEYLRRFKQYTWCPEIISWDYNRQICFKWYDNTCETKLPDNYREQIKQIVTDLHNEKVYKPAFYTKYAFVNDNNIIKLFNFYSCSDYWEQPLSVDFFKPILNTDRLQQVENLATDGKLDVGLLYKLALTNYIKWPGDILPDIYREVHG